MYEGIERPITINDLLDRYEARNVEYYQSMPDHEGQRRPTGEHRNITPALRRLRRVAGCKPIETLSAMDLKAVRQVMLTETNNRGQPLSRSYIQKTVGIIRRCMKWAKDEHGWITPAQLADLQSIAPLKFGRSNARETRNVDAVDADRFERFIEALNESKLQIRKARRYHRLSTMLQILRFTGMRCGELLSMLPEQVSIESCQPTLWDQPAEVHVYRPPLHKTSHHGIERVILIGPNAWALLEPFIESAAPGERLFPFSSTQSFRQDMYRAMDELGIARFRPNQVRHLFGVEMRQRAGLDATQVLMGHQESTTTEIYAKPTPAEAEAAVLKYG